MSPAVYKTETQIKETFMKIRSISSFKDQELAEQFFNNWVNQVSDLSGTKYDRLELSTSLGNTIVWTINADRKDLRPIMIFPGFRTCGLFWDMDDALRPLKNNFRIFIVDTNGQPCLSEGKTPDIKSNDYGYWSAELIMKLGLENVIVAGASFGGLVCLKLCIAAPELVDKAILLNPGCLQSFSLSLKNLYYNFLPLVSPNRRNVEKFLDKAVFYNNTHVVSHTAKKLIIDYELFAITQFIDKAQKPYAMSKTDLGLIDVDVFLILGDKDILFPYKRSITIANKHLRSLRDVFIVKNTGHGIETSKEAIEHIFRIAKTNTIKN
jgi:pimeloyl-ACP methyl ester carboxylesterase